MTSLSVTLIGGDHPNIIQGLVELAIQQDAQ